MKRFIKENIKVVVAFIVGILVSTTGVIAATILSGSEVSYTGGKVEGASNIQQAIDGLYDKATTSDKSCTTGYVKQNENGRVYECIAPASSCTGEGCKLCKRATSFHTETCNQTSGYCVADGYTTGDTITYGNTSTTSGVLTTGDAFDCDVNGDGTYDNLTERFYYVSTKNNGIETDSNTAVLIYYTHTVNGSPSTSGLAWYSASSDNSRGPDLARNNLPTEAQWNTRLTQNVRNITRDNNTIGTENFSYEGYAARLMTQQEVAAGCHDGSINIRSTGALNAKCNFLYENSKYANPSNPTNGPWLETIDSGNKIMAMYVTGGTRCISVHNVYYYYSNDPYPGARPAIEVQLSEIEY